MHKDFSKRSEDYLTKNIIPNVNIQCMHLTIMNNPWLHGGGSPIQFYKISHKTEMF